MGGKNDALARGARTANYFNSGKAGDEVDIKNVMSDEDRAKLDRETAKVAKKIKAPVKQKDQRRLVPKNDQIIVQRREPENMSAGGVVFIPDAAKEKHAEGVIMEVSNNVALLGELKKGDYILFGKYAGTEHQFGNEVVLFMSQEDVIATVEN